MDLGADLTVIILAEAGFLSGALTFISLFLKQDCR